MYVRKRQYYHYLVITFLIKNHDFCLSICGDYHTHKFEVIHNRHAKRNDVITMYDIIKFHIEIIYCMI